MSAVILEDVKIARSGTWTLFSKNFYHHEIQMLIYSSQYQRFHFQKQPVISGAPVSSFLFFFSLYKDLFLQSDTSEIKPLQ